MPVKKSINPPKTSPAQIAELKRLASGIIRAQGNRFIKELLREKKIPIGANKDDFERNLNEAIESGQFVLTDVEKWLDSVEGWGNQHVYLYRISPALQRELTPENIRERVRQAKLDSVWNKATILSFPEDPQLTSISFDDSVLRLVWQEASTNWIAVHEKDYTKEEGLDTYEYHAFRKGELRIITRFEAHLDEKIAGLFIPIPIVKEEHALAIKTSMDVLEQLFDLQSLQSCQFDISTILKNLDQACATGDPQVGKAIKTHKSRLAAGGSYVEFAAEGIDNAYGDEQAIQNVRLSVRSPQLRSFHGAEGVFIFQPVGVSDSLVRPLRVQLYGQREKRIRLWAQMSVGEVWSILTKLIKFA